MTRVLTIDDTGVNESREVADTETVNVGNITPIAGDLTFGSPAGNNINIYPGGTGIVDVSSNIFATGYDLGSPTSRLDTGYFDTINANTIIGELDADGTNSPTWTVNEDAVATTPEDVGIMWEAADGSNIQNWRELTTGNGDEFHFQFKQNPTDPKDLTETGYTDFMWFDGATGDTHISGLVAEGNVYIDGHDIGTVGNPAGDVYATNYYGTFNGTIAACGTTCNAWEINNDAASGTPEDTGVMFPAGDGSNVQNFQFFNDSSSPEMVLRYKQDPTDPADMTEAGYTSILTASPTQITASVNVDATSGLDVTGAALTVDANGIDCGGNIDLNNTLSFDGAGFIDTSGNNDLTISSGTQDVLVTAGIVDLQSNVTTLDVPAGTGFSIGGVALTTALWTAVGVDVVYGGPSSNADSYHTHATTAANDQLIIDTLTTTAMSQYEAGYVSADNTISPTDCSSATGTYKKATFAGVYAGNPGEIVNYGKVEVQFDSGLTTPAPAAGQPANLSWTNTGQFRNDGPASGSGHFLSRAGVILDASTYGTNQRCTILIQPLRPIKR